MSQKTKKEVLTSRRYLRRERLIFLFILGVILFNYPILGLFKKPFLLFGIPMLYCYILFIWLILIGLLIWLLHSKLPQQQQLDFPDKES